MSQLSVFCPISPAIVYAGSDRVDDLSQFTKFILWALSEKYSHDEISDAVSLGKIVVEEEITYLLQIGFVFESEFGLEISETGRGYLELITSVEQFNNLRNTVHLNRFTGNVGRPNPTATHTVPKHAFRLPEKTSKFIIQNRNYRPLLDYAECEYKEFFSHLRSEFYNSLYFYLYLENPSETIFQEYTLSRLPSLSEQFSSFDETTVVIARSIETLHFSYEDERLLRYRNVIDTLQKLSIFDVSLLSESAIVLLCIARDELNINTETSPLHIDVSTGSILSEKPTLSTPDEQNPIIIPTDDQPYIYDEYIEIPASSGIQYKRILKSKTKQSLYQTIPFSLFEEVTL